MSPKTINAYDIAASGESKQIAKFNEYKKIISVSPSPIFAAWIPPAESGYKSGVVLNELWMMNSDTVTSQFAEKISDQKSLYVPAYQAYLSNGIEKYKKLIRDHNLNSLVIDMKDDYGLLRYESKDPLVMSKAKTSQYAIDIDKFITEFKKDDVYLIARIVAFKRPQSWQSTVTESMQYGIKATGKTMDWNFRGLLKQMMMVIRL